jgi:elongation factor Ts
MSAIKELREATGAGVLDCKTTLEETNGDVDKALQLLRQKGLAAAAKKSDREAREGLIGSYVHTGAKTASLIEVNCETDFVARTDDFQNLVKDLSMQIVAAKPRYVRREDIPENVLVEQRMKYRDEMANADKSDDILDRIITGKLEKYYREVCLLEQPFIKDEDMTVGDLVTASVAKLGENIVVRRFVHYELGE